jgi:hypothetical protein
MLSITLIGVVTLLAAGVALTGGSAEAGHRTWPGVGIGTVRTIAEVITVDVVSVSGDTFIGHLRRGTGDPAASMLRPGLVLLVAFDPAARERLSLADDMVAVRAPLPTVR